MKDAMNYGTIREGEFQESFPFGCASRTTHQEINKQREAAGKSKPHE